MHSLFLKAMTQLLISRLTQCPRNTIYGHKQNLPLLDFQLINYAPDKLQMVMYITLHNNLSAH